MESNKVYISDTHFNHGNIIRYCNRPFTTVPEMNKKLWSGMYEADAAGKTIIHCGDLAFGRGFEVYLRDMPELAGKARHLIIAGNHDYLDHKRFGLAYNGSWEMLARKWFSGIVGNARTWKTNSALIEDEVNGKKITVLCSHAPQEDLRGADYNLFGHIHNHHQWIITGDPMGTDWPMLVNSKKHINISAEMINYTPKTLGQILEIYGLR